MLKKSATVLATLLIALTSTAAHAATAQAGVRVKSVRCSVMNVKSGLKDGKEVQTATMNCRMKEDDPNSFEQLVVSVSAVQAILLSQLRLLPIKDENQWFTAKIRFEKGQQLVAEEVDTEI